MIGGHNLGKIQKSLGFRFTVKLNVLVKGPVNLTICLINLVIIYLLAKQSIILYSDNGNVVISCNKARAYG